MKTNKKAVKYNRSNNNNNNRKNTLSSLYHTHNDLTYTIVRHIQLLLINNSKLTLQSLYLLSPFSPCQIRYYYELIPLMRYSNQLPPEYLYELRNFGVKNNSNNKYIHSALSYYSTNKPTISAFRKYIRSLLSPYNNNDKIKIKNSKLNKNLYFIKRQLNNPDNRELILDTIRDNDQTQ